jgi:hypothetical protein
MNEVLVVLASPIAIPARSTIQRICCVVVTAIGLAACGDQKAENLPKAPPTPDVRFGDATKCKDPEFVLFDNFNPDLVSNGGQAPSFDTGTFVPPGTQPGTTPIFKRYCLIRIETYHWNKSSGASPGKIGLTDQNGAQVPPGPWAATGSPGQDGTPNANWTAPATTTTVGSVVLIEGKYKVNDSSPGTWSGNAKAGRAFARVVVKGYDEGP